MVYDTPHGHFLGSTHWQEGVGSQGAPEDGDDISIDGAGMLVEVADQIGEHQSDLTELFESRKKHRETNGSNISMPSTVVPNVASSAASTAARRPSSLQPSSPNILVRTPTRTTAVSMQLKSPYEIRNGDKDADPRPPPKKQRIDDEHIPLFQILRTSRTAKPRRPPGMTRLSTAVPPAVAGRSPVERRILAREEAQKQKRISVKETIDLTSSQSDHPQNARGVASPNRNVDEHRRNALSDQNPAEQSKALRPPEETRTGWFQPPANIAQGQTVTISKSGAISKSALNFPTKINSNTDKSKSHGSSSRPPRVRSETHVSPEAQAAPGTKPADKERQPAKELSRTAARLARPSSPPVSTTNHIQDQQNVDQRPEVSHVPGDTPKAIDDGFISISQCDSHSIENHPGRVQDLNSPQSLQRKRETKTKALRIGAPKESTAKRKVGLLCQLTGSSSQEKRSKRDTPKKAKKGGDSGIEANASVNAHVIILDGDIEVFDGFKQARSRRDPQDTQEENEGGNATHIEQSANNGESHQIEEALNAIASTADITASDVHRQNWHAQADSRNDPNPPTLKDNIATSKTEQSPPAQTAANNITLLKPPEPSNLNRLPVHNRLDAAFLTAPGPQNLPVVSADPNTLAKPNGQLQAARTTITPSHPVKNHTSSSTLRRHESDPSTLTTGKSESRNGQKSTTSRPTEATAKPSEVLKRPFRRVETAPAPAPAPAAAPSEINNQKGREREKGNPVAGEGRQEQKGPWTVEAFDLFGMGPRGVPEFVRARESDGVVKWSKYVGDGAAGVGQTRGRESVKAVVSGS